ncbi:MAG: DUF4861 family protein [Melioribacteraceae bacterium]
MIKKNILTIIAVFTVLSNIYPKDNIVITLRNTLARERGMMPVEIGREKLGLDEGQTVKAIKIIKNGVEWSVPFQLDDMNEDGKWDLLFTQIDIGAKKNVDLNIELSPESEKTPVFVKTVNAIIDRQPREPWVVTKPTWESELMSYCTYGAAQVDVIGKTVSRLTLDYFYGKEPHTQHVYSDEYGMDFLFTGNTMSVHSIFIQEQNGKIERPWTTNGYSITKKIPRDAKFETKILSSGPLRAIVKTVVTNWQTDAGNYEFEIIYSIAAKKRYTSIDFKLTKFPGRAGDIRIGAGMRQMYEDNFYRYKPEYLTAIARDVTESGILDKQIGRAIITTKKYKTEEILIPNDASLKDTPNNGPNYGILFPKGKLELKYACIGAWEKDGGVVSSEQWTESLNQISDEVGIPLEIVSIK